jgi:flavin-dependent dehydrogenase
MKSAYEAVVVGAGPAGRCAAIHLKKLGIDVLLLDKATFPRVCGDGIPSKAFPLLEEFGNKRVITFR